MDYEKNIDLCHLELGEFIKIKLVVIIVLVFV